MITFLILAQLVLPLGAIAWLAIAPLRNIGILSPSHHHSDSLIRDRACGSLDVSHMVDVLCLQPTLYPGLNHWVKATSAKATDAR
jgi:hypothetical protein